MELEHLYLEITHRCNLDCSHCSVLSHGQDAEDPDFDSLLRLLKDFRNEGGRYLTISGGEPGLRSDLPALISKAGELDLVVTLYTNGFAVTKDVLESLKCISGMLAISLDGPDSETHESMRRSGNYEYSVKQLEKAIAFLGSQKVMLSCVLSNPILRKLEKLVEFVQDLDVVALYLGMFEPLDGQSTHSQSPSVSDLVAPVLYLLDSFEGKVGPRLLFSESYDLLMAKTAFSNRRSEDILGRTIKVQADGWAYPGPFFYDPRFRLGRPYDSGFKPILQSSVYHDLTVHAERRMKEVEECENCFWSARCCGGSLALTWATYGNFDRPCPLCGLYKATLERAGWRYLNGESTENVK
jgi:radical SAM protein with 4Fe4S-binding SPASM domain